MIPVDDSNNKSIGSASLSPGNSNDCSNEMEVDNMKEIDSAESVDCEVKKTGDSRKSRGFELECEMDALELARQVAIEVEREVVDYREPFCSSPDVEEGKKQDPEEVVDDEEEEDCSGDGANESEEKKEPQGKELLEDEPSAVKDSSEAPYIAVDLDRFEDPGSESPPLPSSPNNPSSSVQIDKSICNFDLNEKACAEGPDCSPIAIFATCKEASALSAPPRLFEGGLGWKGTAATSAFRPASPRRTQDAAIPSYRCKQKTNFIEIDLNVTDPEEDVVSRDLDAVKVEPASSSFPSGDSSVEVSSRRVERLGLDLNRLGDEDAALALLFPQCWPPHRSGGQSPSPASSSSTRRPSSRDFDLNDNPGSQSKTSKRSSAVVSSTSWCSRGDDRGEPSSSFTILGSRLLVERRKAFFNHSQKPYTSQMPPQALSYGFTGIPPFYGHGTIPCGFTGTPPSPSGPPFLMSLSVGPPPVLNSGASSLPGVDLNTYMPMMSAASSATQQSGSSVLPLKRKQPECEWEPYIYGYKQVASWP